MKPIIDYFDYREYLADFYQDKKNSDSYFSYRYMGKKLAIDPSHIVKILKKQRHISSKSIEPVINFCGLKGTGAEYFADLVRFNKAKSEQDVKQYYQRLLSRRGVKRYTLEKNQYSFYQNWYNTAILTLLDFFVFTGDFKALAEKLSPPITERQAKKSIGLLEELNLIKKDANGRYTLTNTIISCGEKCQAISVRTFQEETMRLAIESLTRHIPDQRNISTVTITIVKEDLPEINEMIKQFRSSLLKIAEKADKADKVFQLNIQLFPLTN